MTFQDLLRRQQTYQNQMAITTGGMTQQAIDPSVISSYEEAQSASEARSKQLALQQEQVDISKLSTQGQIAYQTGELGLQKSAQAIQQQEFGQSQAQQLQEFTQSQSQQLSEYEQNLALQKKQLNMQKQGEMIELGVLGTLAAPGIIKGAGAISKAVGLSPAISGGGEALGQGAGVGATAEGASVLGPMAAAGGLAVGANVLAKDIGAGSGTTAGIVKDIAAPFVDPIGTATDLVHGVERLFGGGGK